MCKGCGVKKQSIDCFITALFSPLICFYVRKKAFLDSLTFHEIDFKARYTSRELGTWWKKHVRNHLSIYFSIYTPQICSNFRVMFCVYLTFATTPEGNISSLGAEWNVSSERKTSAKNKTVWIKIERGPNVTFWLL